MVLALAVVACVQAIALAWIGLLMARERATSNRVTAQAATDAEAGRHG